MDPSPLDEEVHAGFPRVLAGDAEEIKGAEEVDAGASHAGHAEPSLLNDEQSKPPDGAMALGCGCLTFIAALIVAAVYSTLKPEWLGGYARPTVWTLVALLVVLALVGSRTTSNK